MATEKRPQFTVINNIETAEAETKEKDRNTTIPPNGAYHSNPMYEKLLQYRETQRKKRFTVEDLLKW